MRLRINKHKAPKSTLRGILQAQVDRAIHKLDNPEHDSLPGAVHDVRKRVKKMRAALRLFQVAAHPEITKENHRPLRDASREIAAMRDTHVNLRTMRKLCKHFEIAPAQHAAILRYLQEQKEQAGANSAESIRRATCLLGTTDDRFNDGGIRLKPRELRDGLAHIYKRGRKAFRKAANDISEENLHRWRKRTKDILYDLALIASPHPKAVRKLARQAKALGAVLGEEHDLALLQQTLKEAGLDTVSLEPLINVRRLLLQRKIMKSGADFFFRKPEAFVRQFTH